MEAVLDVEEKYTKKNRIKRVELEYGNMEYIILNMEEKVIDVDGVIYRCVIDDKDYKELEEMIWEYENIDEFDYWPDKTRDHAPISPMWRIAFYDEIETYYHKSGALSYPPRFIELVNKLKKLEKQK